MNISVYLTIYLENDELTRNTTVKVTCKNGTWVACESEVEMLAEFPSMESNLVHSTRKSHWGACWILLLLALLYYLGRKKVDKGKLAERAKRRAAARTSKGEAIISIGNSSTTCNVPYAKVGPASYNAISPPLLHNVTNI